MSAFSSSSLESDRILSRLAIMAPSGKWRSFRDWPQETQDLEAFCVISRKNPGSAEGFCLSLVKPHRVPERLGEVFARLLTEWGIPTALGSLCRADSQIGSRICQTPVKGVHEYYYVKVGAQAATAAASRDGAADWICSVGRMGHIPVVGATAASLVTSLGALGLSSIISVVAWHVSMLCLALVSTVVCAGLERWARTNYLAEDPREVVLDEVAGMSLTLALSGPDPLWILASFVAFRFFDIVKPGIHWVEERGWRGTIVWDDLLAGLYAGVSVLAIRMALGN